MNIAERLARYEGRGFVPETAVVNVLLEEALRILFSAFPGTFVFFGGASLVLFYGSPRHSGDLDLLISAHTPPSAHELRDVLYQPLNNASEVLGIGEITIEPARAGGEFLKLVVRAAERALFTIDLANVTAVIRSELVDLAVPSHAADRNSISVASRNWQLLLKAEAFLNRRVLKARDAFDIKLLTDSGAALNNNLEAHLTDGPAGEKLWDSEFIFDRIRNVNSRTCRPELRPYLPRELYDELEQVDFEPLRRSLEQLFSKWL